MAMRFFWAGCKRLVQAIMELPFTLSGAEHLLCHSVMAMHAELHHHAILLNFETAFGFNVADTTDRGDLAETGHVTADILCR